MSLKIFVERSTNGPGSFVNGTVTAKPEPGAEFYVKTYSISLIGKSSVKSVKDNGLNEEVHQSSLTFLHMQDRMYEHPIVLQRGRVSDFLFIFPEDPTFEGKPNLVWSDRLPEKQALPPSGDFGQGNSIAYSVEISIEDEISRKEITATAPLTFSPTRVIETPEVDMMTTAQVEFLALQQNKTSIKLALDSPKIIVQENPFRLVLRLLNETVVGTVSKPPAIRLTSCLLLILEQTVTQSQSNIETSSTKDHVIARQDVFCAGSPKEPPVIPKEGLDIAELLNRPIINSSFAPMFKIANIQRSYGMKVQLEVICDEEKVGFTFDLGLVSLLPAETRAVAQAIETEKAMKDDLAGPPLPEFRGNWRW